MDFARSLSSILCFLLIVKIVKNCNAVIKFFIITGPLLCVLILQTPKSFLSASPSLSRLSLHRILMLLSDARIAERGHFAENPYTRFNERHAESSAGTLAQPEI